MCVILLSWYLDCKWKKTNLSRGEAVVEICLRDLLNLNVPFGWCRWM